MFASQFQIRRSALRAVLCAAAGMAGGAAQAGPVFTDWTSMNTVAEAASGTLGFTTVFLNASNIDDGFINNEFGGFSSAAFSPPTVASDALILVGRNIVNDYRITFGESVLNPIIHLHSLASDLTFYDEDSNPISVGKLSGDAGLTVSGNQARGVAYGSTDSNGTIQLNGSFNAFRFSAFYGGREQFYFQVGATQIVSSAPPDPPDPSAPSAPSAPPALNDVPEPSSAALAAAALVLLAVTRRAPRGHALRAQPFTQST